MFTITGEPQIVAETREKILREFQDLQFQEVGHIYTLHGQQITQSVSGIGHRFIREPFDEQMQAQRYAAKNGGTAQYWIGQWRQNAFRATTLGTKTHAYGESLGYLINGHPELICDSIRAQYMTEYNYLAPIHPKEEAVLQFFRDMPESMHLVLNETKVYSGKNPDPERNISELICGTFDMLYYYDGSKGSKGSKGYSPEAHQASQSNSSNGLETPWNSLKLPETPGFIILDYKTNRSLYSEYNEKFQKTLLPPFDNMIEEDLSLYTIQLSLYSLMLQDIGIPIIDRRLVWLTDDGTYQIIPVPDVSEALRQCL